MRLLNTSTLEVEEFLGRNIPEYAILSHTWETEEVTFKDVESGTAQNKKGYTKLKGFCKKAAEDGFTYCWVDTCCIDKRSSSELSESINSMYQWYHNSRICYAYLADFKPTSRLGQSSRKKFSRSRWWTRGWTLQELLAPVTVEFYDAEWVEYGSKVSLHDQITEITGIDEGILRGEDLTNRTVAVRMSWAAGRRTTRVEDQAYCLLGIFQVNMPLLYGEGERAFVRLQEEIMRIREDYTLFAWAPSPGTARRDSGISIGILASSPGSFEMVEECAILQSKHRQWVAPIFGYRKLTRHYWSVFPAPRDHDPPLITSRGVRIALPMLEKGEPRDEYYACVSLLQEDDATKALVCITLNRINPLSERYVRQVGANITLLPVEMKGVFNYRSIYVIQSRPRLDMSKSARMSRRGQAVSFVVVKADWQHISPMECYYSSWVSMTSLLASKYGSEDEGGPLSASTIPTGPRKGGYWESRFEDKLADVVSALGSLKCQHGEAVSLQGQRSILRYSSLLKYEEVVALAMDNPPDRCWFADVETSPNYRVSGVKGVLGFGHERYPNAAFLVVVGLFDDGGRCDVVPVTLEALQDEANHEVWREEAQEASLTKDRVVFDLHLLQDDFGSPSRAVEVTVSVRRVATSSIGVKRYMLSISQKSLSRPRAFRNSQSWEESAASASASDSGYLSLPSLHGTWS